MPTIAETIENAVQYHQGEHLPLAEKLYKMVLQNDPNNPVALHSLGIIAHQRGNHKTAVKLIGKAIENNPRIPQFHTTIGLVFEALGKFEEAVAAYQQAVFIKPDYAEAYHNMAVALQSQGQYSAAVEKCKQAVSLMPDYAEAYNTMGFSMEKQEQYADAIENYMKAIQFKPDFVVSVDTAVLHLAGAMGKPTLALLPFSPDWRWMLNRQDSPWYPTMKLFRQKKWGQWEPVFQRAAEELRTMADTEDRSRRREEGRRTSIACPP